MKRVEKNQIIDTIVKDLSDYKYVYVADISNLNSESTSALRRLCFKREVKLKVVKNKLLLKAMEQLSTDFSELYPILHGNTSIMLSNTNNAPAKIIKEFRGKNAIPALKGAYVEENIFIGDNMLDALITIKTREELIGDIIGLLQSPAKNVISALQSGERKLAGVVKTLCDKKE